MQYTATAVMSLNDNTIDFLKKIQMKHIDDIPEGAKYIAFLEDGDACFVETLDLDGRPFMFPRMVMVSYYTNFTIDIDS